MSRMHHPAHPGEVLREWLPEDMTVTQAAKDLRVSRLTLSKLLNGHGGVTANLALRPGRVAGYVTGVLAGDADPVGTLAGPASALTWDWSRHGPLC